MSVATSAVHRAMKGTMAFDIEARVKGLARRIALTRRFDALIGLLAVPYVRTTRGVNVIHADYYGMLTGRTFATDGDAAEHYFRHGWKLGIIPTPFIHLVPPRFSSAASLLLRNQLARVARGSEPRPRWLGTPSRIIADGELTGSLDERGGWIAALTRRARKDPRSVTVVVGLAELTWEEYLQGCRLVTRAAQSVLDHGLIDLPFYESQVGGMRLLSAHAALDDYICNGELDGRMPNPFFEAEWYQATDRSQARRTRPVNLLLDFVDKGELGNASPHFWGKRYVQNLGHDARVTSPLANFLARARTSDLTPACEGIASISRGEAERVTRGRVAEYHSSLHLLRAPGAVLDRHPIAASDGDASGSCLVIVDEKHLRSGVLVDELADSMRQMNVSLKVAIIESDDVPRIAQLDELVAGEAHWRFVSREHGETLGRVVVRLLEELSPDGWTLWTPAQDWSGEYVAATVAALRAEPSVSAAAVVASSTPQPWLRTADALWLDGLDGAGVMFRGSGVGRMLPDLALDFGLEWHLLIDIAAHRRCAVIDRPLVRVTSVSETVDTEVRAGANAARGLYLVSFDAVPRAGTTVSIPTFEDWTMTVSAVRAVLATTDDTTFVVVVDNGSRRPVATIIANCFASEPRVIVRRMPRNTDFAVGSNIGAITVPSETTVFLNNDTVVQGGWIEPLQAALEDGAGAAQPLLLFGDRTVQTAGTIFLGGLSMPRHLFAEAHVLDVDPKIDDYRFSALTAACLAVRWSDLASVGGFDPHYVNGMEDVDFCLRLRQSGRSLRVRTSSRVVHYESRTPGRYDHQLSNRARFARRWRRALTTELDDRAVFDGGKLALVDVLWHRFEDSPLWEPQVVLRPRRTELEIDEHAPRLRWAIKSSATGDHFGDTWGDTFFATALADALARLGQEAVVDRITSHVRPSSAWDDVTLTLRGLSPFTPQPGALNLLWVISHPDLVTRHELESGYARIYSAGALWGDRIGQRWGIDVRTLLQATDATKFNPRVRPSTEKHGALFVGRTRGVARAIVADTIAAGGEPEVYGDDGWEQFINPRYVRGSGIPNDEVPQAYADAAIVLNDHWRDMAEFGFFSNRLFDAAATGARVISDPVLGMEGIFGRQVRAYRGVDELSRLLDPSSPEWPEEAELIRLAESVARDHSFDARARTLLDDVLGLRAAKG
jgi:GT2 family glycosyltransferase